ncbi:MAG: hypothetical protein AB7K68_11610 [Bacteriovoracia bacterium]
MQTALLQFKKDVPAQAQDNVLFLDKKHLLYRRMERWVRLQQFVYGLPDDFSYSVHATENSGVVTCRTLVRVGWMSWYGVGKAADRQQALSVALLETSEAISANAYKVFFYSLSKWLGARWRFTKLPARSNLPKLMKNARENELLAG